MIEAGKFDADDNPATPEQQAITMFSLQDGFCVFEGWIPLPDTLCGPNDLAFHNNALYVTASCFPDLTKGSVWKITLPDQGGVPLKWLDLPNVAPNPIAVGTLNAVPHLFIGGLGTNLDPSAPGHNGALLRVRISDRQRFDYPGIVGMYDGLGYTPATSFGGGPYLYLSDLSTRRIERVNASTGASSLYVDLSGKFRQTGGLATDGNPFTPTIAQTDFRGDVVIVK